MSTAFAVRECIRFHAEAEVVEDAMHLASDLGLGTLDRFEIVLSLEDRFDGLYIDDATLAKVRTVGDLVRLVEKRVGS